MIPVSVFTFDFNFPAKQEPAWANQIERWTQMDAPSYGIAEAYWNLRGEFSDIPSLVILASPGASNETDHQFTSTGARSPAKFVHTLPNIRSAGLLKLMNWGGPVLCFQKDPMTLCTALAEAADFSAPGSGSIWIVHVESSPVRRVHFFILNSSKKDPTFSLKARSGSTPSVSDRALLQSLLSNSNRPFAVSENWEVT